MRITFRWRIIRPRRQCPGNIQVTRENFWRMLMKPFMSIKYTAALLPALVLGISVASAEDTKRDRPCDEKQASVQAEKNHGQKMAEMNHDRKMSQNGSMASERASAAAKANAAANSSVHEVHYLATTPAGHYFSRNIVGHEVLNRRDNKVIGTVDELLIDRDGQIRAVLLSTGGIMGMGEKDLAISWDQIERKINGEDITLSVDISDASLVDAPSFARE